MRSTVDIAVKKRFDRRYGTIKMANSNKATAMARLRTELEPTVRVVGQFSVPACIRMLCI